MSALRAEQARATRHAIRSAGAELFMRDGYERTSMRAIAEHASVSERTVYLAFPKKSSLLDEIIRVAVRGDDADSPMLSRPRWQAVLDAEPSEMISRFAAAATDLWQRTAEVIALAESAAPSDPELAELSRRGQAATRADLLAVATVMKRRGVIRRGMSAGAAADALFVLAGNETVYLRLVRTCGWSPNQYKRFLQRSLAGALGAEGSGYE